MTDAAYPDAGDTSSVDAGINPGRRRFLALAALTTAAAGAGLASPAHAHDAADATASASAGRFQPGGPLDTTRALPCDVDYSAPAHSGDIAALQEQPISFPPDAPRWDPQRLRSSGWLH